MSVFKEREIADDPKMSYHVELENVTNTKRQDIKTLVDLGRYFSIFVPRQSGKTTFFEDFCSGLEKDPGYTVFRILQKTSREA